MRGFCRPEFLELTYFLPMLDEAGPRERSQTESAENESSAMRLAGCEEKATRRSEENIF